MLIRVVRMTFRSEEVNTFLKIFREAQLKIQAFPGCTHLELWRDYADPRVFATFSHWESDDALQRYRSSELFRTTWRKTKRLFAEKPEAWSYVKFEVQRMGHASK